MGYSIDASMILDDLRAANHILTKDSRNFLMFIELQDGHINTDQFKILNQMHDEVLKAFNATE